MQKLLRMMELIVQIQRRGDWGGVRKIMESKMMVEIQNLGF